MGKVHRFMGLTVGLAVPGMSPEEKRAAYACDITYGTNNEFGFDYLRDNMVVYKEQLVQREHAFAIVDEVDSILIDCGAADPATAIPEFNEKLYAAGLQTVMDEKQKQLNEWLENQK